MSIENLELSPEYMPHFLNKVELLQNLLCEMTRFNNYSRTYLDDVLKPIWERLEEKKALCASAASKYPDTLPKGNPPKFLIISPDLSHYTP